MSIDEQQLTGRVAVVTGGSRGIGRGIAEVLAERGAAVVVAYRERADAASSLVSMIQSNGGRAWAGQCDVSSEPSVVACFERVVKELGPVDILINNAGVARDAHIMLLDSARWHELATLPQRWSAPKFPLKAADFITRGIAEGPALGHVLTLAEDAWLAADFPLDPSALADIADQAAARFTRDHRL